MIATRSSRPVVLFADADSPPVRPAAARNSTPRPHLARVEGVELFDTGTHKGDQYTPEDIDELLRNFQALSTGDNPPVPVPVVLGHDEDQEILKRDDLPAAGWVQNVYRIGSKLVGDFTDVVPEVAHLINQRAYRRVSAEINPDFDFDGTHYGKVLWRVGLLGAAQPAVKSLKDIPKAKFTYSQRPKRTIVFFSDANEKRTTPMDRNQMLDALRQIGFNTDLLTDAVPDETLAEILRMASGQNTPASNDNVPPAADGQFADGKKPCQPSADNVYRGDGTYDDMDPTDPADPGSDDFSDRRRMTSQDAPLNAPGVAAPPGAGKQPSADAAVSPGVSDLHADDVSTQPPRPRSITRTVKTEKHTFSDMHNDVQMLKNEIKRLQDNLREIRDETGHRLRAQRKAKTKQFCDQMIRDKKLLPAEVPALTRALETASTSRVLKFSDGGRETVKSQFDLLCAMIEARPPILRFAEQLADPAARRHHGMSTERKAALLGATPAGKAALARKASRAAA